MATKKTSSTRTKTSSATTGAKKRAPRKRVAQAAVSDEAAPAATQTPAADPATVHSGDRLTQVARTIGSTVGTLAAKTKKVLHRG